MDRTVAVLDTGYGSYDQETEILRAAGYELRIFSGERHDRDGKIAFAMDSVGAMLRWTLVDEDFLVRTPSLRAVVRYGVGYDNVDLEACSRHGVFASNVRGYANHSVSDHALAMMFACARNLKLGMAQLHAKFAAPPRKENLDLHDKTLGIVGLGNIGGTLAVKAATIFSEILACDPYVPEQRFSELGVRRVGLDAIFHGCDVISLHCNLTDETRDLVDDRAFGSMQRKPILINTARGPVVSPPALLKALDTGQIHSAGVDVFPEEPPGRDWDRLLAHPHLIATGHYAWHSIGASRELQRRAAENMAAMLRGEVPDDCLNPQRR